jgi:hypothetical protein
MHGSAGQILQVIARLVHGANYDDPARFVSRDYDQLRSSQFIGSISFGV